MTPLVAQLIVNSERDLRLIDQKIAEIPSDPQTPDDMCLRAYMLRARFEMQAILADLFTKSRATQEPGQ